MASLGDILQDQSMQSERSSGGGEELVVTHSAGDEPVVTQLAGEEEAVITQSAECDIGSFCKRYFVCQVCNDASKEPITLSCLHSYCPECLNKCAREQREQRRGTLVQHATEEAVVSRCEIQQQSNGQGVQIEVQIERHGEDREADDQDGDSQPNDRSVKADDQEVNDQSVQPVVSVEADDIDVHSYVPHIQNVPYDNENFTCHHGCNTGLKVDEEGVIQDMPPVNKSILNIRHSALLKERLPQHEIQCVECGEEVALYMCNECGNKPFCQPCRDHHSRARATKGHHVVDVSSSEHSDQECWSRQNRQTWYCDQHRLYPVNKYCVDHDCMICSECCLLYHRSQNGNCQVKEVDVVYNEHLGCLRGKLQQLDQLREQFDVAFQIGESVKSDLKMKCEWAIENINDRCDQLVSELYMERDRLVKKAKFILESKVKEIDSQQEDLQEVSGKLKDTSDFMSEYSKTAIPSEFMSLKTQLVERADSLLEHYWLFDLSPTEDSDLSLKMSNFSLPSNAIGHIYSTPCVKKFAVVSPIGDQQFLESGMPYKFTIESHDIAKNHISSRILPKLEGVIAPARETKLHGRHCTKCDIQPHPNNGKYTVRVTAPCSVGEFKLHIYTVRPYPHKQYYIQNCPLDLYIACM